MAFAVPLIYRGVTLPNREYYSTGFFKKARISKFPHLENVGENAGESSKEDEGGHIHF
jgi:hypothetical protein